MSFLIVFAVAAVILISQYFKRQSARLARLSAAQSSADVVQISSQNTDRRAGNDRRRGERRSGQDRRQAA
jgi:hypothetical protein